MASAARLRLRGRVYPAREAYRAVARGWRRGRPPRSRPARVGFGAHTKELAARGLRPLRAHAKPTLPWELRPRPRLHNRRVVEPLAVASARRSVRGAVSWHLYARDARRIRDARRSVRRRIPSLRERRPALLPASDAVPFGRGRGGDEVRHRTLSTLSRVQGRARTASGMVRAHAEGRPSHLNRKNSQEAGFSLCHLVFSGRSQRRPFFLRLYSLQSFLQRTRLKSVHKTARPP